MGTYFISFKEPFISRLILCWSDATVAIETDLSIALLYRTTVSDTDKSLSCLRTAGSLLMDRLTLNLLPTKFFHQQNLSFVFVPVYESRFL